MKSLLTLWLLILAVLRPAAGEGETDDQQQQDDQQNDQQQDDQGGGDLDLDSGDQQQDQQDTTDYKTQLEAERAETQRVRAELEAARRPPPQQFRDPVWEEEERILKDPKSTDLEKWRVESSRTIRESRQFAAQANGNALDAADRTAFSTLAVTKPDLHKRYAERVEKEYQRLRGAGQFANREAIMKFMIGDDAMKGTLRRKAAPGNQQQNNQGINRGKLPGARSDTNGKGAVTDREKRRARLENQLI